MATLSDTLKEQTKDLIYISETDSNVEVFSMNRKIEFIEWDNFFRKLKFQDERWIQVKETMEEQLDNLKVMKTTYGVRVTYELTGENPSGRIYGIRFKGIET